jgi:predicted dinucleotide-binding enzyme
MTMRVTIIGAGMMGRGIGTRAVCGGHDVEILDRDPAEARALADQLTGLGRGSSTADDEGRVTGEVVVLALPYQAGALYAEQVAGKVVVDVSNPVDFASMDRLLTPPDLSAAEELAQEFGDDTFVVKAFNTTFAATLVDGQVDGQPLDVLLAGDDESAKHRVAQLVLDGGMRAIDAGPLRRARQLEHLGFLHMALQGRMEWGFQSAVKFLR